MLLQEQIVLSLKSVGLVQLIQQLVSAVRIGLELNESLYIFWDLVERLPNLAKDPIELLDFVFE